MQIYTRFSSSEVYDSSLWPYMLLRKAQQLLGQDDIIAMIIFERPGLQTGGSWSALFTTLRRVHFEYEQRSGPDAVLYGMQQLLKKVRSSP